MRNAVFTLVGLVCFAAGCAKEAPPSHTFPLNGVYSKSETTYIFNDANLELLTLTPECNARIVATVTYQPENRLEFEIKSLNQLPDSCLGGQNEEVLKKIREDFSKMTYKLKGDTLTLTDPTGVSIKLTKK